jgi:phospholipid/cholesterol/gamma-HCH transport system substrate-binding protein
VAFKVSKEVRTGIIVIITIALFIYGFNILKGRNIFSRTYTVYAVYHTIDGLVVTNPVQINGFKVGQIKNVKLKPDHSGKIVVEMLITEADLKIARGSQAKIISQDLLGTKAVTIITTDSVLRLAMAGNAFYKDKDTLAGDIEEGIKEGVTKTLAPLQKKAKELLSSIDSVMTIVQVILNKDARTNLIKSFESIKIAIGTLEKTAFRLDTLVASEKYRIHSIFGNIDHISSVLAENSDKLGNILKNLNDVTDSLAKAKITSALSNANLALAHAADVLDKINKGEGSLGLLVNDKRLYNHLDSASADLDKLFIDLNAHPKRYVHFSVFGKKEKAPKKKPAKPVKPAPPM